MSHANHHGLDGQQAAGLQRVALQGHRQREDEFEDQDPAGDERPDREEQNGIEDQKRENRAFVPVRRNAEEVRLVCGQIDAARKCRMGMLSYFPAKRFPGAERIDVAVRP